jgi:hypothetical protein
MVSFYPKKNSLTPNVFSGICLQRVNVNKKPTYFELLFNIFKIQRVRSECSFEGFCHVSVQNVHIFLCMYFVCIASVT